MWLVLEFLLYYVSCFPRSSHFLCQNEEKKKKEEKRTKTFQHETKESVIHKRTLPERRSLSILNLRTCLPSSIVSAFFPLGNKIISKVNRSEMDSFALTKYFWHFYLLNGEEDDVRDLCCVVCKKKNE